MTSSFKPTESVVGKAGDRRRHERRPAIAPSLMLAELLPDNFGMVLNLSVDGLAVQPVARMEPGASTIVRCKFPPDDILLEIRGEVVWCNKDKVTGIRFVDLSDSCLESIRAALRYLEEFAQVPVFAEDEPIDFSEAEPSLTGIPEPGVTSLPGDLNGFVQRAITISGAKGCAIAVLADTQFVCRASAGVAPGVGVVLQHDRGLSAECIQSGHIVACPNMQEDGRVDREFCWEAGVASAVLVPILEGATVVAVLECFWGTPLAYGNSDLTQLCEMAASVHPLLHRATQVASSCREPISSANPRGSIGNSDYAVSPTAEIELHESHEPAPPRPEEDAGECNSISDNRPLAAPDRAVPDRLTLPSHNKILARSRESVTLRWITALAAGAVLLAALLGWYTLRGSSSAAELQSAQPSAASVGSSAEVDPYSVPLPFVPPVNSSKPDNTRLSYSSGDRNRAKILVTTLTERPPDTAANFIPLRLVGGTVESPSVSGKELLAAQHGRFSEPDVVHVMKPEQF